MVKIDENLSRLRELRNKADYQDTMFNLPREAKTALMLAQNIRAFRAKDEVLMGIGHRA